MKLISAKQLNKALKAIKTAQADVTLSLAYYGLINGNVDALHGEAQDVVASLHKDYKALVPASFNKKDKQWSYNKAKAVELAARFGLEFQKTTFEEFCDKVCQVQDKVQKVLTDVEQREQAIKRVESSLNAAIQKGVDIDALIMLLRSKKPATADGVQIPVVQ